MNSSVIAVIILILILVPAVKSTVTHMKGEGDCCGGPKEKAAKNKIDAQKLKELLIDIEGMHCTNCKNRIENHVNELEGVICKVNLNKKQAIVELYQEVDPEEIKQVIEGLDFTVLNIAEK